MEDFESMGAFEITLIIVCSIMVIGVFAYSIRQNKDIRKPKVDFIRELFNHFGDGANMKR